MHSTLRVAALLTSLFFASFGSTAEFRLQVHDGHGQPVPDIVAYVPSAAAKPIGMQVDIDQINKEFVPYVTVVPVGSRIRFPNKDNIRHHVYSFSDAKKFELRLYSGVPAEPVLFERAGVVALGCNIHDWMLAYVLVIDTPWFGKSNDAGELVLQLPPGPHQLQLWHPELNAPTATLAITVTDATAPLRVPVSLRPRASAANND